MLEKTNITDWKIKSVVKLGLLMCRSRDLEYPIKVKTINSVAQDMLDIDSDTIIINHADKDVVDNKWYNKAYEGC